LAVEEAAQKSSTLLEKLSQILGEYVAVLANPPPRPVRGAILPPNSGLLFNDHEKLQNRAFKFMKIINNQIGAPSVPYTQQLENIDQLQKVQQDLKMLQNRINQLEEEKEKLEQDKKKIGFRSIWKQGFTF